MSTQLTQSAARPAMPTMPKPFVSGAPLKDGFVKRTALICLIGLGGFLLWAGFAPLSQGIPASGLIVVENSRQIVQHLEGGIVREMLVRDGDRVERGQVLLVLEDTASLANRDLVLQEIASLNGSLQRLDALSQNLETPDFSFIDALPLGDEDREQVIGRQMNLFVQQKQAFDADIAVLTARRDGAVTSRALHEEQVFINRRVLSTARDQLSLIEERFARQMARLDEVRTRERDVAALEGEISRLRRDAEQAKTLEEDLNGQIAQAEAAFARQLSIESLDVRNSLQSSAERLTAAQDVLNRSVIVAPQSGEILNLRFSTTGGVIGSGETILEIVPDVVEVTASVRIAPNDRGAVFEGQDVRTRMAAFKSWMTPTLDGEVMSVSADLKTDQITGASYYEVRVRIPAVEMTKMENLDVIPGMPVEVFIYSGTSRTTLDYLFEPISESLFRGSRTG
jgi:HlyD family type I secretion membrane fusion protein